MPAPASSSENSSLAIETFCGDGVTQAPEECDDGNNMSGDGCTSTCLDEPICGEESVSKQIAECDILASKRSTLAAALLRQLSHA